MSFFGQSDWLDQMALRPLSHIRGNWELTWDPVKEIYIPEDDSYAEVLNDLIIEIESTNPPANYHIHEDNIAKNVQRNLGWQIQKVKGRWIGEEYGVILQQGGFDDVDESELILAAAGRMNAAITRGQMHFDQMEDSHQRMLGEVIATILYHRMNVGLG